LVTLTSEERILLEVVKSESIFHTVDEAVNFASKIAWAAHCNFDGEFELWLRTEKWR
jgi:hypothetical protein